MASRKGSQGRLSEERLARKRENEAISQKEWQDEKKYYETVTRDNIKYNEWTSPRSTATSLKHYEEHKKHYQSAEHKEEEENKKVCEELKEKQAKEIAEREERVKQKNRFGRHTEGEVPLSVLREINNDIKAKDDAIRRIEAEKKMYQQWRNSNPYVKECEMNKRDGNLKIAWLDAQIEKQMAKEKEGEEMKKYLEEREKLIKEEEEKEAERKKMLEEQKKEIGLTLEQQIHELKLKEQTSEQLEREEVEEMRRQRELEELVEQRDEMLRKKSRLEMDLRNLQHFRLKLQKRARMIVEQVEEEQAFLQKMLEIQQQEMFEESARKTALQENIKKALDNLVAQRKLENEREELLGLLFESEAKAMWQKQEVLWEQEKKARERLFQEVLRTLQQQIDEKVKLRMEEQKQLLEERERMMAQIEKYQEEMRAKQEEMERNKKEVSQALDDMVKEKRIEGRRKVLDAEHETLMELEKIRAEEDRLKKEIHKIQEETLRDFPNHRRMKTLW